VRIVYRVALLLFGLLLILFAVSNRGAISVGLWPLPYVADIPLYLLVFLSVLVGAVGGACVAWTAGHRDRRELRNHRRRIEALERELAATQSRLEDRSDPSRIGLPAL
jgi:putative membrane protein